MRAVAPHELDLDQPPGARREQLLPGLGVQRQVLGRDQPIDAHLARAQLRPLCPISVRNASFASKIVVGLAITAARIPPTRPGGARLVHGLL